MPAIGETAPNFTLPGADGVSHSLADVKGSVAVLAFYRGDDTPTCSRQLSLYNEMFKRLRNDDVALFGISPGTAKSHFAFGCRLDLQFPLLADTDMAVAKLYKVKSRVTGYSRAVFVLDSEGTVREVLRPPVGGLLTYPKVEAIEAAVAAINQSR